MGGRSGGDGVGQGVAGDDNGGTAGAEAGDESGGSGEVGPAPFEELHDLKDKNGEAKDDDQGGPVFFEPLGRQDGGSFHALAQGCVGATGYRKEVAPRGMEAQSWAGDGSRKALAYHVANFAPNGATARE